MHLNPLVLKLAPPPIPEARAWAARYDGSLGEPIDLTQAVSGYPPHPELVARLGEAAGRPDSFAYGDITGDLGLREAYAADVAALYAGRIGPDQVAITTGCNMASFAVTMLLAKAGDAIMLPVPWYFNHQMNAAMLGIEVVPLPCRPEAGFVPDAAEAEALIDGRIRAIVLITPNNPTGAIYPPATVAAFADLCRRRGLVLVVDETYRDFRPLGMERSHAAFAEPDWPGHLIQLYSFSKAYCVPGFRAGAVVAARSTIVDLAKILDCLQICAPRVMQAPLAWAIDGLRDWREANRRVMNQRSEACRCALAGLDGWRIDAQGAYFAYLRHPFAASSWRVAEEAAVRRGVVTLPGEAFGPGQGDHLRLAFANVDAERLGEAARRLDGLTLPT